MRLVLYAVCAVLAAGVEVEVGAGGAGDSAAARAPLPALPPNPKFVLYDVGFGERFNFRKSVFRRVMGAVQVLAKHAASHGDWVLVVPPFRDTVGGYEKFAPFGDFMRLDKLRALYPHIIDFVDYVRLAGPKVDHVLMPCSEHTLENDTGEKCVAEVARAARRIDAEKKTIEHFGVELSYGSLQCLWQPGARSAELKDAFAAAADAGAGSIMLEAVEQVRPADAHKHPYWGMRQHMHFAPVFHAEAARFRAAFAWAPGAPYIAMHMRRGDFKMAHARKQSTQGEVVGLFRRLAEQHSITNFYVATDAAADEVHSMKEALLAHGIAMEKIEERDAQLPGGTGGALGSLGFMLVEQIIASQAQLFVGTDGSHFSKEIHLERRLHQGGGDEFYENSLSMVGKGELIPLCRSWVGGATCEILPLD